MLALLDRGADIDKTNAWGETALDTIGQNVLNYSARGASAAMGEVLHLAKLLKSKYSLSPECAFTNASDLEVTGDINNPTELFPV